MGELFVAVESPVPRLCPAPAAYLYSVPHPMSPLTVTWVVMKWLSRGVTCSFGVMDCEGCFRDELGHLLLWTRFLSVLDII